MNPLRAATIYPSRAVIASLPGPSTERYAIPLDYPALYVWRIKTPGVADNALVLGRTGGTVGQWEQIWGPDVPLVGGIAATQTTWYINADTGDDKASGIDAAHPIRTFAEWQRRIGLAPISIVMTVNLVSASGVWPTSDPWNVRLNVAKNGAVKFKGVRYAMTWPGATGNFTSVTALSRGTQTPNSVTNNNLDASGWGTGTGASRRSFKHRMRLTSGASSGAMAWAVKDALTTKTQRVSPWFVVSTAGVPTTIPAPTAITPGATDGYVVETLLELPQLTVDVISHGQVAAQSAVVFEDIQLPFSKFGAVTNNYVITRAMGWGGIAFVQCDLQHLVHTDGMLLLVGCTYNRTSVFGGNASFLGCYGQGSVLVNSGQVIIDGDTIRNYDDPSDPLDGGELFKARAGALVYVGFACSFDAIFGDGALVEPGAVVNNTSPGYYAGELFWGQGGAGASLYGIRVQSGGSWIYSTKPTATGNAGANATIIGGTATPYVSVPSINATNHAKIVLAA